MKNLPELKDLGRADPGLCGIFKSGQLLPRGSIYTTIMELGPQNRNGDGRLGPNSIVVVYMDPLGYRFRVPCYNFLIQVLKKLGYSALR